MKTTISSRHYLAGVASLALAGAIASSALALETRPGPDAGKQFLPIASYRVGPYASSGAQIWAGRID